VKDGLEDAFSQRVAVFVSSDPRDNPGGDQRLDRIKRELKDPEAKMLISLVSPTSVREPWISIELGATWILDRAVFQRLPPHATAADAQPSCLQSSMPAVGSHCPLASRARPPCRTPDRH